MKRKNKDGIVFDNTVYLLEENYRRFPVYMRLFQLLVLFLGGFSFISLLVHCFRLEFMESTFVIGLLVSGSVFFLLLLYPSYDYIKIVFVCATYSGLIYQWFIPLQNGFIILQNAIIERASSYYNFPVFRFITDKDTAIRDMTLLLIMIVIPVELLIAILLLRGKLIILCYMVMIVPLITSFAMGITPRQVDLIVFILVLMFLHLSKGFMYKSYGMNQKSLLYRVNIRSAVIVCLLALLLFNIIKLFVPVKKYDNFDGINTAKSKIQGHMMDLSFRNDDIFKLDWNIKLKPRDKIIGSGGLSKGKLGRVDKVTFNETEHLLVSLPLESVIEGVYLRGYVGSVYTGDGWENHSRATRNEYDDLKKQLTLSGFEPAIGSSYILDKKPYNSYTKLGRVWVTYRDIPNDYVYAPYFASFDKEYEIEFDYDLSAISSKKNKEYVFDYRYNLSDVIRNGEKLYSYDNNLKEYYGQEFKYRQFVYDAYSKLPEKGLDRLRVDFSRDSVGKASENLWDAITYIQDYLRNNTRYTLSPGKLPKGEDFVEYFLYENKLGYCSHYASAGILMLRAMGYPARYVEGYSINRSDLMESIYLIMDDLDDFDGGDSLVEISVKDSNAHAWVEVYVDGFGWVPIEFTPASGMGNLAEGLAGNNQLGQDGTVDEPMEEPREDSMEELTRTPAQPTKYPDEEKPQELPTDGNEDDSRTESIDDKGASDLPFKWYKLAIVLLVVLIGLLPYGLYVSRKRKEYAQGSRSKRALYLYKKIEKIFLINKGLPKNSQCLEDSQDYVKQNLVTIPVGDFENCMDIVRKARFGRGEISTTEYMMVKEFYNNLERLTYERVPLVKRLYLKMIL